MQKFIIAIFATGSLIGMRPAAAQQVQVPIADGVMQISPDGECPEGTFRRTQVIGQQVAQQGSGSDVLP
jgi:hypothetical protein